MTTPQATQADLRTAGAFVLAVPAVLAVVGRRVADLRTPCGVRQLCHQPGGDQHHLRPRRRSDVYGGHAVRLVQSAPRLARPFRGRFGLLLVGSFVSVAVSIAGAGASGKVVHDKVVDCGHTPGPTGGRGWGARRELQRDSGRHCPHRHRPSRFRRSGTSEISAAGWRPAPYGAVDDATLYLRGGSDSMIVTVIDNGKVTEIRATFRRI